MPDKKSYRWAKAKNGISNFAVITLVINESNTDENFVNEYYSGDGFTSQGSIEEVPAKGYDSWKIGAIRGLEYAFSKTKKYFVVNIISIEGISTDTNPTVIGYTIIRAFFDQINLESDNEEINKLEDFVVKSWMSTCEECIPDFFTLTFTEYE
jgi:hypothetical protein